MEEKTSWWKSLSTFGKVSFILIILLVVAIIVQIGIMINLKIKTDETKKKNDEIADSPSEETSTNEWQKLYIEKINLY